MNHPLLEKLETYYIRFKEIGQLITDPEVIQDMERYVRLTKEYKELETITRTADKFKAALLSVEESKDILLHEEDKELREMAEMEIEELEDKLPGMEQELKLLLVPADPDDSKNVILEIRGGTGGDEACLFAGDLFRMYAKFCERKGWKVEVTNANEGTAGGICSVFKGRRYSSGFRSGPTDFTGGSFKLSSGKCAISWKTAPNADRLVPGRY